MSGTGDQGQVPGLEAGKLHVDSDWKERARLEKENLAAKTAARKSAAAATAESYPPLRKPLPPDWVRGLIGHLSNLAVTSLGIEATPGRGAAPPQRDLEHARFAIDMLEQLQKRTAGGLEPDEAAVLEDALYQLRMIFVQLSEAADGAAAGGPSSARPPSRPPA